MELKFIKDETGKVIGYEKPTVQDIIAEKEAQLITIYNEIQKLKDTE
jgi:hypothetical protein